VLSFPGARRLTYATVAVSCIAAVTVFGELSPQALIAVGGAGLLVVVAGLAVRAGGAARPVGRRGLAWLVWLAAASAWELVALAHDDLPTVSDLADPLLAHPAARAAATLGWLAAGAWLIARPRHHRVRP
jgi:hypothetical protein